jgi:hypothetical protein
MATTIYVKECMGSKKEAYYFTDGANDLSRMDFTFKGMIKQVKFLRSIGITVKSTHIDLDQYIF